MTLQRLTSLALVLAATGCSTMKTHTPPIDFSKIGSKAEMNATVARHIQPGMTFGAAKKILVDSGLHCILEADIDGSKFISCGAGYPIGLYGRASFFVSLVPAISGAMEDSDKIIEVVNTRNTAFL